MSIKCSRAAAEHEPRSLARMDNSSRSTRPTTTFELTITGSHICSKMSLGRMSEWHRLPVSLRELCIDTTLRCGQSFRYDSLPCLPLALTHSFQDGESLKMIYGLVQSVDVFSLFDRIRPIFIIVMSFPLPKMPP